VPAQTPGHLGVALTDAPGGGARVSAVQPGSPADHAGLRVGDIVTAVNGSPIDRSTTMTRMILGMAPGQTVRLSILRPEGATVRRLTLSAVLAGGDGAASGPAPPPAPTHGAASTSSRTPAPPGPPPGPLVVTSYTTIADPLEHAFTVQVPAGWRSEAGLARRAALQINPYVRSLSPDKMTYLLLGEPTLPSFVPPSPMRNTIGFPEGHLYDAGLGGLTMVLHSMSGPEFARYYGQSALGGLCPSLHFAAAQERPDLARKGAALVPTVIPSHEDGGEARFTCTHNGHPMEARVFAVTRMDNNNVGWGAILLYSFIAPAGQADKAEAIETHVLDSIHYNASWIQMQNNLSQQAAEAINRRMQDYFRQEQGFMQKLNSVDENWESMDELVSGYSTYRGPSTGNSYMLSNTDSSKWIDESSGRIISSANGAKPGWAGDYRPLTRTPQ
jgi:PDZ domain